MLSDMRLSARLHEEWPILLVVFWIFKKFSIPLFSKTHLSADYPASLHKLNW